MWPGSDHHHVKSHHPSPFTHLSDVHQRSPEQTRYTERERERGRKRGREREREKERERESEERERNVVYTVLCRSFRQV